MGILNDKKKKQRQYDHEKEVNQMNIDFQNKTNQENRQFALDMFDKTNAYNAPAAQMERYREANLNPNLIYGQSNTTSPTSYSGTAPRAEMGADRSAPDESLARTQNFLGEMATSYNQTRLMNQQLATQKAQEANIEANTVNTELDTVSKGINNDNLPETIKKNLELKGAEITAKNLEIESRAVDNSFQEARIIKALNISDAELEQIKAGTKLTQANTSQVIKQTEIIQKKLPYELKKLGLDNNATALKILLTKQELEAGEIDIETAKTGLIDWIQNTGVRREQREYEKEKKEMDKKTLPLDKSIDLVERMFSIFNLSSIIKGRRRGTTTTHESWDAQGNSQGVRRTRTR